MKLVCLDREACAESHYLTSQELASIDLQKKFHKCFHCNQIAILVVDNFVFTQNQNKKPRLRKR
jgi:hypothetical protein